ncbi:MAG: Fic family protein [Acidobacteria bacterium]|nr:Fic family protein [Acidobacteriota bacterium]
MGLRVPLPAVRSFVTRGARRTTISGGAISEFYPLRFNQETLVGNLKFALRYEPVDLGVLDAAFKAFDQAELEEWVRGEPTGIFARRAWYLYEFLTGRTLDVPDVPSGGYVDLLNPDLHLTGPNRKASRQRVTNNLLGGKGYCPLIRRTEKLDMWMAAGLAEEAKLIVEGIDPATLARAVQYLYTKETKSSFEIEGETVGSRRAERFVAALHEAAKFDPADKQSFIRLQNSIVDPRYAASDWRDEQNYVGQTMSDYREHVHFVAPKPEDLPDLMGGWMATAARLDGSRADPLSVAAALSFGFVFIHPFEDGNGRIHRFLIHHVLARSGFTPNGLLFPVSAVMLRDMAGYDEVLRGYSSSILPFVDYSLDAGGRCAVHNETAHLYRYWDATGCAEYLYGCVNETVRRDLKQELGFLSAFDEAMRRTAEIVDMPDRRASLLVRMILQNGGTLSKTKRPKFPELTDDEIGAIEAAVRSCTAEAQNTA